MIRLSKQFIQTKQKEEVKKKKYERKNTFFVVLFWLWVLRVNPISSCALALLVKYK